MLTLEKGVGYALTREQLLADNPRILAARERWADRSAGADACHPYLSTRDEDGYGKRRIRYLDRHITVPVSRIDLAITEGLIGADHQAAHLCQNPVCVNPRHLIAAPPREHTNYDAEPKRLKRLAKHLDGNVSFPVWLVTNEDAIRIDWGAEAQDERLLAGHLVREMGWSWYDAYRFAARRENVDETADLVQSIERYYQLKLVEPDLRTALSCYTDQPM